MRFPQPLSFRPLYMERVWGGRRLADHLGRSIPANVPIGESWELVDRSDAQSIVDAGSHAGMTLHELWKNHRESVFGPVVDAPRFPLLAKILDARETLSVQVHPPAALAVELGGEPKTEMWHLLEAEEGAELYAGFRKGVTRSDFETALKGGEVAGLLHRISVQSGDTLFIPSGRCHAIGAGCLIVEIQQNSDTTYRVFDWNRLGLDGKPRALHVEESLKSIDFADFEPGLAPADAPVECPEFFVETWQISGKRTDPDLIGIIYTVLEGSVRCGGRTFARGDFFLLPATAEDRTLEAVGGSASVLRTRLPVRG
jgi:mannose-6-phosphate isomerase